MEVFPLSITTGVYGRRQCTDSRFGGIGSLVYYYWSFIPPASTIRQEVPTLQTMGRNKTKHGVLQTLIWVYGTVLINIPSFDLTVGNFNSADYSLLIPSVYGTCLNAIIFYGNWKILLQRFSIRAGSYWLILIVAVLVLSVLESCLDQWYLIYGLGDEGTPFWKGVFLDNLLIHIIFFLLPSYGFWSYERYVLIREEQQMLQEQKLQAELSLMRSQINPHFLFNVLNNLFASAHHHGDAKTANGISNLAEMMRYMLYDSSEPAVTLDKEINYIEDFIALQRFRFTEQDNIIIRFKKQVAHPEAIWVSPMLFIPFIENAFKHGLSLDRHANIAVHLATDSGSIQFSCKNTVHRSTLRGMDKSAGFGLKNIKHRLELLYPDQYQLDIRKTANLYEVQLNIDLNS